MNDECRPVEVTFKYYLPEHQDQIYIHTNALKMLCLLSDIDQKCRSIEKYASNASKDTLALCEEIRQMICEDVDLNRLA